MNLNSYEVVKYAWIGLSVFWIVGMLFSKPVIRRQPIGARLLYVAVAIVGLALVGGIGGRHGWMYESFVPATAAVRMAGAAITVAGCLFAAWARIALGTNWSARVTVKANHELIVKGPYALARHPIYTGILTAFLGTTLVIGQWRALVGVLAMLLALAVKMTQEERVMMETFPDAYPAYRKRVKALIPGLL